MRSSECVVHVNVAEFAQGGAELGYFVFIGFNLKIVDLNFSITKIIVI